MACLRLCLQQLGNSQTRLGLRSSPQRFSRSKSNPTKTLPFLSLVAGGCGCSRRTSAEYPPWCSPVAGKRFLLGVLWPLFDSDMIKRRFYRFEHGDRDIASDSSSSSSGYEIEARETDDSQEEADEEETSAAEVGKNDGSPSASSGYESENSSGNEVSVGLAGSVSEDDETGDGKNVVTGKWLLDSHGTEIIETVPNRDAEKKSVPDDAPACIMKCKSVFKCKICPRIVCLNEDTMRAHLKSKRHSRSEKLLKEGRLKAVLNSDGEIEKQEIVAEKKDPVSGDAEGNLENKQKGRNRWRKGSKNKRTREEKRPTKDGVKKRRKDEKGKV